MSFMKLVISVVLLCSVVPVFAQNAMEDLKVCLKDQDKAYMKVSKEVGNLLRANKTNLDSIKKRKSERSEIRNLLAEVFSATLELAISCDDPEDYITSSTKKSAYIHEFLVLNRLANDLITVRRLMSQQWKDLKGFQSADEQVTKSPKLLKNSQLIDLEVLTSAPEFKEIGIDLNIKSCVLQAIAAQIN